MFCALLLLQYPFVFAMERGNTERSTSFSTRWPRCCSSAAGSCWPASRPGLAAGFKLSPIVAIVVDDRRAWCWRGAGGPVDLASLRRRRAGRLRADAGGVLPRGEALPAGRVAEVRRHDHAREGVGPLDPDVRRRLPRKFGMLLGACLVAAWVWAGARALARGDAAMALAGSLAVSTYIPRTSYDYNLISTYPLLLLLFLRAQRTNRWALLAFGVFAIAGDRRLFSIPEQSVHPGTSPGARARVPRRRGGDHRASAGERRRVSATNEAWRLTRMSRCPRELERARRQPMDPRRLPGVGLTLAESARQT